MALRIIKMRLETSNGVAFGEFHNGHVHSDFNSDYASEGGTCFLNCICVESGEFSSGYIINYKIRHSSIVYLYPSIWTNQEG